MKPLLVGEDNPLSLEPQFALYPAPDNSAGWRLCVEIMGLGRRDYLERFDRTNLCVGTGWNAKAARASAGRILASGRSPVVLCGSKVAGAFGFAFEPFTVCGYVETVTIQDALTDGGFQRDALDSLIKFALIPHPSGRCRIWNEPDAIERARETLRAAGVL